MPPGVPERSGGRNSQPLVESRAANVLWADSTRDGQDQGMARKFGWVRKLPSGRYQASYVSPDGTRVTCRR